MPLAASIRAAVLAVVAVALLLAFGAAPARAAFVAESADPAGDATSGDPGHDITGVGMGYDRRTGLLAAAVQLRGAPGEAPAFVSLVAVTRTATGCDGAAVGFGSFSNEVGASWFRFANPGQIVARGEADKDGYREAVQQFEVTDRALRGLRPDCVVVSLSEPGNAQNVYDIVGPLRLVPMPSLSLKLGGVPERVRSGRTYRLEVTVGNPGDAPTGRVALRLARVKGMTATPRTLALRSIAAGKRRTATLTVRFGDRAPTTTDLRVTAAAGRLRLEGETTAYVYKPDRDRPSRDDGGGNDDGGRGRPGVCTRWFPDISGDTGGSLGLVPCQYP